MFSVQTRNIDIDMFGVQLRTVPGSVDGIRSALAWAGLEYDYGMGT